jgi:hypothetical protein
MEDSEAKKKWLEAFNKELRTLQQFKTYEVIDKHEVPMDAKILNLLVVFTFKRDGTYKARIVANGSRQKEMDKSETYAPVAAKETIHTLVALWASKDWEINQFDFTNAFLNGRLEKPEYAYGIGEDRGRIWKITGNLYGLKQAPKIWNDVLNGILQKYGFTRVKKDGCVYKYTKDGVEVDILVYVDDLLVATWNAKWLRDFKKKLMTDYRVTDGGPLNQFLGLTYQRNREERTVKVTCKAAIEALVKEFAEKDGNKINAVRTPMESNCDLVPGKDDAEDPRYRKLIGGLMYIATWCRPDIAYAVGVLSRFTNKCNVLHWHAAKRVVKYLYGTQNMGIQLGGRGVKDKNGLKLTLYTDADWAGDTDTRKSTTGYLLLLGNSPVCWKSKRQSVVAQSTCEAEYMALGTGAMQLKWLVDLLEEVGEKVDKPVEVHCDNQGAIAVSKVDPPFKGKTRHVDIKYELVNDLRKKGLLKVEHCDTDLMLADGFTKALVGIKHQRFVKSVGFVE